MMYMYFIFLLGFFFFFFCVSLFFYYMNLSVVLEWLMLSMNSLNLEFLIFLDWISLSFISIVFLISSMVMLYSIDYMKSDKNIIRFYILILFFVFSMVIMILSPNIFSILFGWDGLGVTSYCLVIYYQNYSSYSSGMVTVLMNRIGDIGILMAISLMLIYGSWNMFMLLSSNKLITFMLIIASITKSAQIPFSSWLPLAMAAPTPVSSLVHSSTLVTAGVYLMIRYSNYLELSGLSEGLIFLSVLTMFMSGIMANYEVDLKKIIALSTLSQLGLMMMVVGVGCMELSLFHLMTHAMFKSLLFLCAGILIHSMKNNQDIRMAGGLWSVFPFTMMSFMISSFALSGFPFLAGFYSKDMIMELIFSMRVNIMVLVLSLMSLSLTVSYSFRLFYYLFLAEVKLSSHMNLSESGLMVISLVILLIMSILSGSLLSWVFFFDIVLFVNEEEKMLILLFCFLGIGMFFLLKWIQISLQSLFFFSTMWFLDYFYKYMNKMLFSFMIFFNKVDKEWVEHFSSGMFFNMVLNMIFFRYKSVVKYKGYMFMMFLLSVLFILMMIFMIKN